MVRNYFVTVFRNLFKHKAISAINVIGLAIGMAAFLIVLEYVMFEYSYDRFHENKENIYRVESRFFKNDVITDDWPTSSGGYGPAMQRAFPSIKKFARVYLWGSERVVSCEAIKHRENNVFIADASFLEVFSFSLTKGSERMALAEPNSVILSESAARKYFGDSDPMGKVLKLSNAESVYECVVTGIFKDVPPNSHITFDILISWTTLSNRWKGVDEFWYQHEAYTYILLEPTANIENIELQFQELAEKYKTREALKDLTWGIKLVALNDIRFNPQKSYEREVKGSKATVWVLGSIAVLILFIAWINYINLSTTRALERAKEIGIRKTSGASQSMLITQFLLESGLINLISISLAVCITWLTIPYFQTITTIKFDFFPGHQFTFYLVLLIIFLMGVLISGLYPALVLASFNPIRALKGKITRYGRGKFIRKSLVTFQFAMSMVLITISIVVFQQVQFMRNQDLGLNTDQVLVLKIPALTDKYEERLEGFRNELLRSPGIWNVTISSSIPGKEVAMFLSNRRADIDTHENRLYEMLRTDHDFLDTYQMKVLYGRNFSRDVKSDESALILNEEAVKLLNYKNNEEALNKEVYLEGSDKKFKIIGVVKNYHHTSLRHRFTPIMLFLSPDYRWIPFSFISLSVTSSDWNQTIRNIRTEWNKIFPESSFDYFFLDEFIDQQYKSDVAFGKLVSIFCALIIGIACLGLLGLTSYDTALRKKEVGVRKVLGASIPDLMLLLSRDLIKLLAIAYGIALPLAYILATSWLIEYTFHTGIEMWMLMIPVFILLPVALLSVGSQLLKAAKTNPVDSLRYE